MAVNVRGKNLWNNTIVEEQGAYHFGFLPAGTYTFSMLNVNDWWTNGASGKNFYVSWAEKPDRPLAFGTQGGIGERNSASFTITKPSDITIVTYNVGISNDVTDFQLEVGSTPTSYAPYAGTTATLTLPETIYGGTLDVGTGVGVETWKIFDLSTATYSLQTVNGLGLCNFQLTSHANGLDPVQSSADFISSSLPIDNQPIATATKEALYKANSTTFYVRIFQERAATVEDAKAYLASINAKMCYKLATPQPIQATGSQSIPALPGTNTVYTDAGNITVTGASDPIAAITALQDRVSALESTALN